MKCNTCGEDTVKKIDCDWRQGRCPHRPAMIEKPYPVWLLLLGAPFIIGSWMVTNPRKVWEQAKKDLDL